MFSVFLACLVVETRSNFWQSKCSVPIVCAGPWVGALTTVVALCFWERHFYLYWFSPLGMPTGGKGHLPKILGVSHPRVSPYLTWQAISIPLKPDMNSFVARGIVVTFVLWSLILLHKSRSKTLQTCKDLWVACDGLTSLQEEESSMLMSHLTPFFAPRLLLRLENVLN